MRHNKRYNPSFGRHRGPRKALIRGLVHSLVEHERIKTTLSKAKYTRPLMERAITMGKRGDIHSRRLLFSRYPNKKTVDKIMDDLSPRFQDRQGGYTRIIKLGFRQGDQAPLAYIEFVDYDMNRESHQAGSGGQKTIALSHAEEPQQSPSEKDPSADKKSTKGKLFLKDKKLAELAQKEGATDSVVEDKKAQRGDKKSRGPASQKTAKYQKRSAVDKKPITEKKKKKQLLAQVDKKRKKSRLKQKKSRRTNRP